MAGGRLLPRRDEHGQHVDPRSHDRLWPVRFPRRLRCGLYLQSLRFAGPLRLPDAAADRLLEPLLPRPGLAAAARSTARGKRARRGSGERRAARARRLQGPFCARAGAPDARQARPADRTPGRRRLGQPPVRSDAGEPRGFHADLPQSGACFEARRERRRASSRPVSGPCRVRCLGERLPRRGCPKKHSTMPNAPLQ